MAIRLHLTLEVLRTCQLDIRLIGSSIPHPLLHLSIPSLTLGYQSPHCEHLQIVASSFSPRVNDDLAESRAS